MNEETVTQFVHRFCATNYQIWCPLMECDFCDSNVLTVYVHIQDCHPEAENILTKNDLYELFLEELENEHVLYLAENCQKLDTIFECDRCIDYTTDNTILVIHHAAELHPDLCYRLLSTIDDPKKFIRFAKRYQKAHLSRSVNPGLTRIKAAVEKLLSQQKIKIAAEKLLEQQKEYHDPNIPVIYLKSNY